MFFFLVCTNSYHYSCIYLIMDNNSYQIRTFVRNCFFITAEDQLSLQGIWLGNTIPAHVVGLEAKRFICILKTVTSQTRLPLNRRICTLCADCIFISTSLQLPDTGGYGSDSSLCKTSLKSCILFLLYSLANIPSRLTSI